MTNTMKTRIMLNNQMLLALIVISMMIRIEVVEADWSVPENLTGKVAQLSEKQRKFVESDVILNFLPERQLIHELSTRNGDGLQVFVNEIMSLAKQMEYDPLRDMGAAPLNLSARDFNEGIEPTPAPLRDLERQPGPFSVHRYLFPQTGIATFAGAKVAIWPEDLLAGKVDVAIIGIPNDMSSGRRGARWGPDEMRALNTIANPDVQSLLDPMDILSVVDYGNFGIQNMSVELSIDHVIAMVAETSATGATPMMVGGDTSMLYPGVKGIAQTHGVGKFGLLHFSAHPDADQNGVHSISDDQALFLLLDHGIVNGKDTIQVGMRGAAVNRETMQWLRKNKVKYHTSAEIQQQGIEKVFKRVRSELDQGPDRFFISIDVSVIDPSEMIAAGRIVSQGLRLEHLAQMIRHACAAKEVIGFELTDMAPVLDLSRVSVLNANALLNACLVGMAVRKAGFKPDYINPLVADHGQQ